jgi:hypothetical protein
MGGDFAGARPGKCEDGQHQGLVSAAFFTAEHELQKPVHLWPHFT